MKFEKFKPAIDKRVLLFLSGAMWLCVGGMLLSLSFSWLDGFHVKNAFLYAGVGASCALMVHHFGFLRIVDKNLGRILPMEGKRCLFSFMTWKSYMLVTIMMGMGVLLRRSTISKPHLSILYICIGLALILSSIRYLRVLIVQLFWSGQGEP